MDQREILRKNRQVYDAMAAADSPLCRPAKDEELSDPLATVDAAGWLGNSIQGRNLLCLAAGGGRQSSLYAAAGANVTVVDISGAMLELDRRVAAERGYSIRLFETSMDQLSMLRDGEFDIVIHPVSTCYLPNIQPVFLEVARVLRSEGTYISQHKQPGSLQATVKPQKNGMCWMNLIIAKDRYRRWLAACIVKRERSNSSIAGSNCWEKCAARASPSRISQNPAMHMPILQPARLVTAASMLHPTFASKHDAS